MRGDARGERGGKREGERRRDGRDLPQCRISGHATVTFLGYCEPVPLCAILKTVSSAPLYSTV